MRPKQHARAMFREIAGPATPHLAGLGVFVVQGERQFIVTGTAPTYPGLTEGTADGDDQHR